MKLHQFLLDPCDVGVEVIDPPEQDIDSEGRAVRQVLTQCCQLGELAASEAHNYTVLGKVRPHGVDEAGASRHQLLPHRVKGEHRLLLLSLHRDGMDVRPDHGFADGGSISGVILFAALDERFYRRRG